MILLVGQVAADQRDREAFQEIDYRQMFGPGTLGLAKWVGEVHDADRLPEYVARAFRTAMQGRPGPVVLALPEDMLTAPTAAPVLARVEPAHAHPDPQAMEQFRQLLIKSRAPVRHRRRQRLDGRFGVRFRALRRGLGDPGRLRLPLPGRVRQPPSPLRRRRGHRHQPALARRIRESDLVLAVGVRLGEMTTGGYTLLEAPVPRQPLIHFHAGAEELGRVYQPTIALQCSMAAIGCALEDVDPPTPRSPRAPASQAHAEYLANLEATRGRADGPGGGRQDRSRRWRRAGAVYTNGAGNYAGWLHRFHRYASLQREGRTQLAPTAGAMGYGVPAAIAASLLYPATAPPSRSPATATS